MAIGFVVGLGLLLADNLYWLVRNQIELPCVIKACVSPRGLEAVTRKSTDPKIATVANWYFLNRRIPGRKLAVPRRMATIKWHLENLARLRVEVSDRSFIVDAGHVERLRRTSAERREVRWWRRKSVRGQLYLRVDPAATDYVLAETAEADGTLFVMPRSEYAAVAAR